LRLKVPFPTMTPKPSIRADWIRGTPCGSSSVLTPNKIKSVDAGRMAEYFVDLEAQRARGDYYAGHDGAAAEQPGSWLGGEALGVAGPVSLEQLLRLLDGCHPDTGRRIVPWKADRTAAQEFTFSAPKTVSGAWAVGDEETRAGIDAAQAAAVAEAHAWITRNLRVVRRRQDRGRAYRRHDGNPETFETAAAVIGPAFAHHTARQSHLQSKLGLPPDPQIHTHLLLAMAQRHDGRLVALWSEALYAHLQEIDAVYLAALAGGLAEMGFEITRGTGRGGRFFEIAGIPKALCADWSSRTVEIEAMRPQLIAEFRGKYGRDPTTIELSSLGLRYRVAKGSGEHPSPREWWREVGAQHGVTEETIRELRRRGGGLPAPAVGSAQLAAELLGEDGLTEEHAVVSTSRLRARMFQRAAGILTVTDTEELLATLIADGELIALGEERWTTKGMLEAEQRVLAWRNTRVGRPPPVQTSQSGLWAAMRAVERDRGLTLSGEQRTAIGAILAGGYTALTGKPGVGKGVVLSGSFRAWSSRGQRVFALAVAGRTAHRLGDDLGPGAVAMPLQGFLTGLEHGALTLRPDDVIVVDEAGMVGSRQWETFAAAVGSVGTVVLVGDHAQLSPLSAGGLWPALATGGPELHEIQRTKVRWQRTAWDQFREGQTATALGAYARHGHLTVSGTRTEAVTSVVSAWNADGRSGLIVTDASNAECHTVNLAAQAARHTAGELGAEALPITTAHGELALHAGDRVIFQQQWRIPRAQRVENGMTAVVDGVDLGRQVVIVRTNEAQPRRLEMSVAAAGELLTLGYATHVYKAQGATVDRVYVIAGGWQTHRESLYVAMTRSRLGARLFVDRETLGQATDADALVTLTRRGRMSRAKTAASLHLARVDGLGAEAAQEPRKRPVRVLTDRTPLVERYHRRQHRRAAHAQTRANRAVVARLRGQAAARRQQRRDAGQPVAWLWSPLPALAGWCPGGPDGR
jgi:conjugative relaxase-like TrwC/TraI family protein